MRFCTGFVSFLLLLSGTSAAAGSRDSATCFGLAATIVGGEDSERLVGTEGRDIIAGGGGRDVLLGKGGADVICGGDGSDRLQGGPGDDRLGEWALGGSIAGGPGADRIEGNGSKYGRSGDDVIRSIGGPSYGGDGDDHLSGSSTFVGGPGDDIINGTGSWEGINHSDSPSAVIVDLREGVASSREGHDLLIGIEYALGSRFDDRLTADTTGSTLIGNEGNDVLIGGAGDDRLEGLAGSDEIRAGAGKDSLYGDHYYAEADDGDDLLRGGAGRDHVIGAGGDDDLDGGKGHDGTSFGDAPRSVEVDLIQGTATGWGRDRVVNFEDVSGSDQADVLKGTDGPNVFYGLGICGCQGDDDTVFGKGGDDTFYPFYRSSRISGGEGNDVVSYVFSHRAVRVDLSLGTARGATNDSLEGIETIVGTSYDDEIRGSSGDERLIGDAGDDVIDGGGGSDFISGDCDQWTPYRPSWKICEGMDTLAGAAGDDTILGGVLNDLLDGGLGTDGLNGGKGVDVCLNGEGLEDCE